MSFSHSQKKNHNEENCGMLFGQNVPEGRTIRMFFNSGFPFPFIASRKGSSKLNTILLDAKKVAWYIIDLSVCFNMDSNGLRPLTDNQGLLKLQNLLTHKMSWLINSASQLRFDVYFLWRKSEWNTKSKVVNPTPKSVLWSCLPK